MNEKIEIQDNVFGRVELWAQGNLDLVDQLPERGFAVVGTRNPTQRGRLVVSQWIEELRDSKLILISGLARGIDAEAHVAALDANLPTVAILGCGLACQYPRQTYHLRQKITDSGGLILSELPPSAPARPFQFLQRNRLIAGLANAVLVVESAHRSGALNTAKWAQAFDRDLYAVPNFPGDPVMAGNQKLIDLRHAHPFWGVHSLGATWLELATHRERAQTASPLLRQIEKTLYQDGQSPIGSLLSWHLSRGRSTADFFATLARLKNQGRIRLEDGCVVRTSSPASTDS